MTTYQYNITQLAVCGLGCNVGHTKYLHSVVLSEHTVKF